MLYLDFAQNREDFILEKEEKYPYFIKRILYFLRKLIGQPIMEEMEGKRIIIISKWNSKTIRKLDKIFEIDVTKNICVCDRLRENQEFMNYLKEKNLNIIDGKWLFQYLVCEIAQWICNHNGLAPEQQEISILANEVSFLLFETIQKLSLDFKNITVATKSPRKFDRLEKEIYEKNGLMLNVTNNFKNACTQSKIIFNFDFLEKDLSKIRIVPDAIIVNLEKYVEVKQSNFRGQNIDFYTVNLPIKYYKLYKRLNHFHSSILYESFIYKKTAVQNIWKEIQQDKVQIISLESGVDKFYKKQ
ncbi:MAG: hypothetical protein IJ629_03990 [Clostridia bacterium]|nr:hypothetical protein [Clostridia bacterium]